MPSTLLDDYILPGDPVIAGFSDASAAFARAKADGCQRILGTPGRIYYVKDVILDGCQFDGQGCVLRDAPNAGWGLRLNGFAPSIRNLTWQDQGNYVSATELASPAVAGASSLNLVSTNGIQVGDVIFVEMDSGELRHQSFVTAISGTAVTIRDGLVAAAAAGRKIEAMVSAIRVGSADHWMIEDVLVVNARGALLLMPEDGESVSSRGSLVRFRTDGFHYFGVVKAGNTSGIKAHDIKLWGGFVESISRIATGAQSVFAFQKKVYILRDITVRVDGVKKDFGTAWIYESQTSIRFLNGHIPSMGAKVEIDHFRDGFFGFVEDQRDASIISGGNLYDAVEVLDAFAGVVCREAELTDFRSLISDSCQYTGLDLVGCSNTLVFSGDTFLGFSGCSLKLHGSIPKNFISLYTRRVPPSEQWPVPADANIYIDPASDLRVNAAGWTGEFQTAGEGKLSIVGGHHFDGRSIGSLAGGSNIYLCSNGATPSTADATYRAPRDGTLKSVRVDVDIAPGANQSYTYDVLAAGVSVGQVKIEGAARYWAVGALNTYVVRGTPILLRLVTSSGAAATARHQITAILV